MLFQKNPSSSKHQLEPLVSLLHTHQTAVQMLNIPTCWYKVQIASWECSNGACGTLIGSLIINLGFYVVFSKCTFAPRLIHWSFIPWALYPGHIVSQYIVHLLKNVFHESNLAIQGIFWFLSHNKGIVSLFNFILKFKLWQLFQCYNSDL